MKAANEEILESMIGKTITEIDGLEPESFTVVIHFRDRSSVTFTHHQDCCEEVRLFDFELTQLSVDDLVGGVVNDAREDSKFADPKEDDLSDSSGTWTFYNINTSKGCINMRWLGESNGYYSEAVDLIYHEATKPKGADLAGVIEFEDKDKLVKDLKDFLNMLVDIVPKDTAIITGLKGWRMSGVVELEEEGLVVQINERRIPPEHTDPKSLKRRLIDMAKEDVKYGRAEILLERKG